MAQDDNGEREVLTSLPRSRPARRSAKRGARDRDDGAPSNGDANGPAKTPGAASKAAQRKPRATAKSGSPKAAAKAAAPKADGQKAATPKSADRRPRPAGGEERATVPPERKVPPAGYAAPSGRDPDGSPGATEILSTAIQAASELAQIGFSVGRQALQSALERLPKP